MDSVNFLKAQYYFRKQDFKTSLEFFNKLLGTSYESDARIYIGIIYRYNNEKDKINEVLIELDDPEYEEQVKFNRSKIYKDQHTPESLEKAYELLSSITFDIDIRNMVNIEMVQILIKLGKYDLADEILEDAYDDYAVTLTEYLKYKGYIFYKKGSELVDDPRFRTIFMNYVINYNSRAVLDNIKKLNDSNKNAKKLYLSHQELEDLYYDLMFSLDHYDYYMSDLYDVYIIDMGRVIGSFFGIETRYLEVKCEQNTKNIHTIQPTLKKVNVTRYNDTVRKRTDLGEN
jgi:hypothetical protein